MLCGRQNTKNMLYLKLRFPPKLPAPDRGWVDGGLAVVWRWSGGGLAASEPGSVFRSPLLRFTAKIRKTSLFKEC